jgi:hypothetical protein
MAPLLGLAALVVVTPRVQPIFTGLDMLAAV